MKDIMYYWTPAQKVPEPVWIAVFIFLPFAFNFLNVRRYGEIEYWLTMIKIVTLVTLFILGVVFLPLGINEGGPLLATNGTDNAMTPVLCPTSNINNGTCLLRPGFNCISHCA
jgi:amino acid permease